MFITYITKARNWKPITAISNEEKFAYPWWDLKSVQVVKQPKAKWSPEFRSL